MCLQCRYDYLVFYGIQYPHVVRRHLQWGVSQTKPHFICSCTLKFSDSPVAAQELTYS